MRFGFLITARCNAACSHCTTSCGPYETSALPKAKIFSLMDEGAALWRKHHAPGEELQFAISGGEPFLDFPLLLDIVAHGASHGAWISCVTNGSWASSDERATGKLRALQAAGLRMLAVSTSRFHREFIAPDCVERALRIAGTLGIGTTLKVATLKSDERELRRWAKASGAKAIEAFPVVPYLRKGARLPRDEYIRRDGLPGGRCPAPTLTVLDNGNAYTCCIPGGFTDFLALGSVHREPLEQIYDRFYLQGKQQTLRRKGPIYFARAVIASGQGHRLRPSYESVCDLCAHIAGDAVMSGVAEVAAERYAARRYRATVQRLAREAKAPANPGTMSAGNGDSHEQERETAAA